MSNLFGEEPEAEAFCRSIIDDPHPYLLFPGESFSVLTAGILATSSTHTDGERYSPAALDATVAAINSGPLWSLAQHDPRIQPIGRFLAARRFYASPSDTDFAAGVLGTYDASRHPTFASIGLSESAVDIHFPLHLISAPIAAPRLTIGINPTEIDPQIIAEALADAPTSIERRIRRDFRKAADPLTIVSIAAPVWLFIRSPFMKALQEQLAKDAAAQVSATLGWIKQRLSTALAARYQRSILYEFTFEHSGCRVQFLIDSKDPTVVASAVDSLEDGATRALRILENGKDLKIQKLVYLYDHSGSHRWLPLHAASLQCGVISDRPKLIAMDSFRGFSLAGTTSDWLLPAQSSDRTGPTEL
jgi:hypothetical protein